MALFLSPILTPMFSLIALLPCSKSKEILNFCYMRLSIESLEKQFILYGNLPCSPKKDRLRELGLFSLEKRWELEHLPALKQATWELKLVFRQGLAVEGQREWFSIDRREV